MAAGEGLEARGLERRGFDLEAVRGELLERRADPLDERERDDDGAAGAGDGGVEDRGQRFAAAADEGRVGVGEAGEGFGARGRRPCGRDTRGSRRCGW